MEAIIITLGWIGIFSPIAFGAIGSVIGCARAGQAACGAMLEAESGHGRFVGISAMPSSQTIYGIVVTLSLNRVVNELNAPGLFAIGVLTGLALMMSAIHQGNCCAASISRSTATIRSESPSAAWRWLANRHRCEPPVKGRSGLFSFQRLR